MRYVSIGDMAQTFQLRRNTVELQRSVTTLTDEMSTGRKADLSRAVGGDFGALASFDRTLETLGAYRTAATEAGLFAGTLQSVLGGAQDLAATAATGLIAAGMTGGTAQVDATAADARARLASVIDTLNTGTAGRYVLSGTATDRRPLAGAEDMLAALAPAIAGQTTVTGILSAVAAWFDAPAGGGGYADAAYAGAGPLAGFRIGETESVALPVTATDPAVRNLLKGLAVAALVADGLLAGDPQGRAQLSRAAGEQLLSADGDLVALRARVGAAEARIAEAGARNAAQATATGIARAGIVTADPYETATALTRAESQLETLYTVTARLARLSFADFLR